MSDRPVQRDDPEPARRSDPEPSHQDHPEPRHPHDPQPSHQGDHQPAHPEERQPSHGDLADIEAMLRELAPGDLEMLTPPPAVWEGITSALGTPRDTGTPDTPRTPHAPQSTHRPHTPGKPLRLGAKGVPRPPDTSSSADTPDELHTPKTPNPPRTPNSADTPDKQHTPKTPNPPDSPDEPHPATEPLTQGSQGNPDGPNTTGRQHTPDTAAERNRRHTPDKQDAADEVVVPLEARRRRAWRIAVPAAAAAALALVIAGIAAYVATANGNDVIASAVLTHDAGAFDPLGAQARADAELVAEDEHHRIRLVDASLPPAGPDADLEAWLIQPDDRGNVADLVSLGLVDVDTADPASLAVPPGYDPSRYFVVDISVEPRDGDPSHSGRSILRGALQAP